MNRKIKLFFFFCFLLWSFSFLFISDASATWSHIKLRCVDKDDKNKEGSFCGGIGQDIDSQEGSQSIKDVIECNPWQKCVSGTYKKKTDDGKKTYEYVTCLCAGECLKKPENPRYYDNPNYSNKPDKDLGNSDLKLPLKLDWDDVEGWHQEAGIQFYYSQSSETHFGPTSRQEPGESYGPWGYNVRIQNTREALHPTEGYNTGVKISEFNSVSDAAACLLKSNSEVPWHVKACCDEEATDCGEEAHWNLTTSDAPELISPEDPDWAGNDKAENIPIDLTLKWCEAENARSYQVGVYEVKGGSEDCHFALKQKDGTCKLLVADTVREGGKVQTEISNSQAALFTRSSSYAWQVRTCLGSENTNCGDWSQKWKFDTEDTELGPISLLNPPHDPDGEVPVGLPVTLVWKRPMGAYSFVYEVIGMGQKKTIESSATLDYPQLQLDTSYSWRARACWDENSEQCEEWSETRTFRTTGRPPKTETLRPKGSEAFIPVDFTWEDVPGNKSFIFKITGSGLNKEITVPGPKTGLSTPDLKQEKTYSWQVKTCAREQGELCGPWSESAEFTTSALLAPSDPDPADGATLYTYQLPYDFSWKAVEGARAYKYTVDFISKSEKETDKCPAGKIAGERVTDSYFLFSAGCLGTYQWQVQACLDEKCKDPGGISSKWTFYLAESDEGEESEKDGRAGFVVCGRRFNDPDTPWNEREPCQIKHLFLMAKVILEWFLFHFSILLLVILTLITGIIYYNPFDKLDITNAENQEIIKAGTVLKVKKLWQAAGLGYLILIFGWLIVELILVIFGYKLDDWWKIQ